ncbi:MAG TPA: G1 family glutamic endopeptidase [Acidimicrobiales bacterium]|nr:G1 family glutamic endopeptidase [Acidimicrobiales bacterium]
MSAIVRSAILGTAVVLGVGFLASPAFASPSHQGRDSDNWRAPWLIDTNIVVGFPQHQSVAGGVDAQGSGGFGPTVATQPQSETVTAGSTASFSAAASGFFTPSVQWYVSANGGSSFSAISGATSDTYSFTAQSSKNGYEYRAVFSDFFGSATTNAATLTVTAAASSAPSVTTEPQSETVTAGSTASFSATASGNPTPTVQWQLSTNGGSSFSAINGATSDTYSFTAQSPENGSEYEAVFTNGVGSPATTTAATLTVTTAPVTPVESSNWSGYADTGGPYNRVSATWPVPTVTCSQSNSYSAEWIGIDGYSSSTVEQDGSEADCSDGSPSYYAWYEMYGDNSVNSGYQVELSPSTYPVSPGDTISASVSVSGTTWTLAVSDSQKAWSYSTNIGFSGAAQSSAEWVVERPEECNFFSCSLTSLADFGSVQFSSASATANSSGTISASSYSEIEMVNGSTVLALPGALDAAGDSFTDTWKAAG